MRHTGQMVSEIIWMLKFVILGDYAVRGVSGLGVECMQTWKHVELYRCLTSLHLSALVEVPECLRVEPEGD